MGKPRNPRKGDRRKTATKLHEAVGQQQRVREALQTVVVDTVPPTPEEIAPWKNAQPEWEMFVREYVVDYNGARAYQVIHPNVDKFTGSSEATKLLRLPYILRRMREVTSERVRAANITAESTLLLMNRIANANARRYGHVDDEGRFQLDLREASFDDFGNIREIETTVTTDRENGAPRRTTKIKIIDPTKGVELLARYHKMLTDKTELTGPNGTAIMAPSLTVMFTTPEEEEAKKGGGQVNAS